jgi:hypothetical protein
VVPTHRDHPWEHDARARRRDASLRGRPPQKPTWRVPLIVASLTIVALIGLKAHNAPALGSASTNTPPTRASGTVTSLQSRLSRGGRLEFWGSTTAPDGASIDLSAQIRGVAIPVQPAPAISGHFYGSTRVPRSLRGARVLTGAVVAP